jgi:hypothetical protein
MLGVELADIGFAAGHQCRCDELGELENRQFFGVVAQGRRAVENPRAFTLGLAQ